MSVSQELESKVGGLPAWAWGGGAVAGILLFRHWRTAQDAANTAADAAGIDTSATDTSSDPGLYDPATDPNNTDPIAGYLAGDPTNPAYNVGATAQGVPAPVTNAQWARLAGDYLIAQGDDPILVSTALYRYIHGQSLNAAQRAVVDLALTHFGTPPQGVKAVTNTPSTPTTPTAPKLTGQATADHRIALSWDAVAGANVYLVFRDGIERGIVRSTHWQSGRLTAGHTHKLYVLPVGLRAGHRSNTVSVRVR